MKRYETIFTAKTPSKKSEEFKKPIPHWRTSLPWRFKNLPPNPSPVVLRKGAARPFSIGRISPPATEQDEHAEAADQRGDVRLGDGGVG